MARIGFLGATFASSWASQTDAFRVALRDLGYVEGTDIAFESRWADERYERLPPLPPS